MRNYAYRHQRTKSLFYLIPLNIPILGDLQISETMVVSWIVMIIITGLCIWLTHDLKVENISKRQAAAEMIVETLNNFVVGNMGEKFRYMIPFVGALFGTSIVSNLISLTGLRSPDGRFVHRSSLGSCGLYHDYTPETEDERTWRLSERFYRTDLCNDAV